MIKIIGLTGGLATGKTTVAELFGKLGAKIIDADKIARRAIQRDGSCFHLVVKRFGQHILTAGDMDHGKLAKIVFGNPEQLLKLEKIIHPVVRERIKDDIKIFKKAKGNKVVVMDVPLLFEAGFNRLADLTIVVKATQKKQIERARRRSKLTLSEAMRRIKRQMPLSQKVRLADIIIDNNGTIKETEKQVKMIWQKI